MNIEFTSHAWEDFNYWVNSDSSKVDKINQLLKAIKQMPFNGLGSPEPLKHDFKGYWSRRINSEHRLVYKVVGKKGVDQKIVIIQCRFHY
ncbi:MAG: Txe/YoeB family addiction module toxin [Flavobacteriales bacterium]|nr:Txe/YoeB family addiction module toxin [Flavobacteriales bacterium]